MSQLIELAVHALTLMGSSSSIRPVTSRSPYSPIVHTTTCVRGCCVGGGGEEKRGEGRRREEGGEEERRGEKKRGGEEEDSADRRSTMTEQSGVTS